MNATYISVTYFCTTHSAVNFFEVFFHCVNVVAIPLENKGRKLQCYTMSNWHGLCVN